MQCPPVWILSEIILKIRYGAGPLKQQHSNAADSFFVSQYAGTLQQLQIGLDVGVFRLGQFLFGIGFFLLRLSFFQIIPDAYLTPQQSGFQFGLVTFQQALLGKRLDFAAAGSLISLPYFELHFPFGSGQQIFVLHFAGDSFADLAGNFTSGEQRHPELNIKHTAFAAVSQVGAASVIFLTVGAVVVLITAVDGEGGQAAAFGGFYRLCGVFQRFALQLPFGIVLFGQSLPFLFLRLSKKIG